MMLSSLLVSEALGLATLPPFSFDGDGAGNIDNTHTIQVLLDHSLVPGRASDTSTRGPVACDTDW